MSSDRRRNHRLISLFLLGFIMLSYPILSLFDLPKIVWGIPLLFGYIFFVWVLLIVLVILIVSSRSHSP